MWTIKSMLMVDVGILLFLMGLLTKNYQAFALGIFLISMIIVSGYKTVRMRLDIVRTLSVEKVFEGHEIEVRLRIKNLGRKIEFLEIIDELPPVMELTNGSNYLLLSLKKGEEFIMTYSFKCHLRGHYHVGPVKLRSRTLFGFFYSEDEISKQSYFTVFPRVEDLTGIVLKSKFPKLFPGALAIRQVGSGTEFYSIREYVRGDELKKVNWKAYARRKKLMVNEFERENVSDVLIVLDSREGENVGTTTMNPLTHSCRAAATLANYFLNRKDSVGLAVYSDTLRFLPIDSGEGKLYHILEEIAATTPTGNAPLSGVMDLVFPQINPKTMIILVSSLENDLTLRDAIREISIQPFDLILVSPSPVKIEKRAEEIMLGLQAAEAEGADTAYEIMMMERDNMISEFRGLGARVVDWDPDHALRTALMGVSL